MKRYRFPKETNLVVLAVIVVGLSSSLFADVSYYISPSGKDSNTGDKESPFATLEKARDTIRSLKASERKEDIHVILRGGTYYLKDTFVLKLEDSAQEGNKIYYEAYAGEEPVLSSGVRITGWQKLEKAPEALPEKARDKVWVADVPREAGKRFLTLYDGDKRLPRARSKAFFPGENPKPARDELYFPAGTLKNWTNLEDVELLIIPKPWTMNILPLESVDEAAGIARTSVPGSYNLLPNAMYRGWEENAWIENVIDFLDEPGEWVVNSREGKVYLWPSRKEPGDSIMAPRLKELIRVEGGIDLDGPTDTPVQGLIFKGLTFTCGERDVWDKDHGGWGLQHDWEMWDRGTALLRFRGAEDCAIEECRFANSGGTAIRLDLYCQKNRIEKNLVEHMGALGILLCGYGPGTKDVNKKNTIINNHIRHIGELYWHGHGIMLWQSGENYLAHNLIHHGPRKALCISGVRAVSFRKEAIGVAECSRTINWDELAEVIADGNDWRRFIPFMHARGNIVEYNESYRMLQKLRDGSVFNVSGAGEGNILRRNHIHHIYNERTDGTMRTDGWQCGTLFAENVIHDADTAGIAHKNFNHIENNFIINASRKESIRFGTFPREQPNFGSRVLRNIIYNTDLAPVFYGVHTKRSSGTSTPSDCKTDYNVLYSPTDPNAGERHISQWRKKGIEKHSISADPLFEDIEKGDFRLKANSPALKLGIKSLDVREMGLKDDFPAKFR
ncbi:MAG: right-handed parallel beta-helix repeat-containing protein [Planctomycetota bacterium]|jgi:hypothetical protein